MHDTQQCPSFVTTIYRKLWIPMNGHGLSAVITNNRKSDECSPANCWLIARHHSANTISTCRRFLSPPALFSTLFAEYIRVEIVVFRRCWSRDDEAVIRYHKSSEYPPVWYRPHSTYRLLCKLRWQIHTCIWYLSSPQHNHLTINRKHFKSFEHGPHLSFPFNQYENVTDRWTTRYQVGWRNAWPQMPF